MARTYLPPRDKRPPKSDELRRFEVGLKDLNVFFWASMAGFHVLRNNRPPSSKTTKDFLPQNIAQRLDLSVQDLDAFLDDQEERLRQLFLVDCVTYYEEYIRDTVAARLRTKPLPTDGTATLDVPFDCIPGSGDTMSFLRALWADQTASNVVSSGYKRRAKAADDALGIDVVKEGSEHGLDLQTLKCACLFRNCIIHNAGVVDQRTVDGAAGHIPGLVLGAKVPLDEKRLFDFFEAMLAHARDVDLLARIDSSLGKP